MAASSALDNEFMKYWPKLSQGQKESLLSVAKNFVGLQYENDPAELRKMLIQEEREEYLRGEGKSSTWEEVKDAARNKERRNGL
jgi:hypothetical protein